MSFELLKALRDAKDSNLDLFSEYYCLAIECKEKDDDVNYRYWIDRACDVSNENSRISKDIYKITNGEYVL